MKKGLKTLIVGVVIMAVGVFVIPLLLIAPLFTAETNEVQFIVPITFQTTVNEPGKYYLWNVYQTIHEGKSYNQSTDIPNGAQIIISDANGNPFEFKSDGASISGNNSSTYYNNIGYVEIETPGEIIIKVTGIKQPRIFSFSRSLIMEKFRHLIGGFAACVFLGFLGIALVIWGIVKLMNSNKENHYADEFNSEQDFSPWQNPPGTSL